jgi:hypothetical protein
LEPQPQGNLLIGEGAQGEREREKKRKERESKGERADNKNHGQCRVAQLVLHDFSNILSF